MAIAGPSMMSRVYASGPLAQSAYDDAQDNKVREIG